MSDWQVVEEALGNMPHLPTAEYHATLAALARLREREAQYTAQSADRAALLTRYSQRAEAAEARVVQLEGALREIADYFDQNCREGEFGYQAVLSARRALAHPEGEA